MSDMLQLVVKIGNAHVRRNGYHQCLSLGNHYDKLKHVGHLVVQFLKKRTSVA